MKYFRVTIFWHSKSWGDQMDELVYLDYDAESAYDQAVTDVQDYIGFEHVISHIVEEC